MTAPTVGTPLPSFQAQTTHGNFDSSQARNKALVLYFYPKDNTPGCTTEAQDLRDRYTQFQAQNCTVIGISRDSLKSHEGFSAKQDLPFPLIADTDESLCTLFDVIKLKNRYGKQVRGIERSTFLFDKAGILVKEWRNVRVAGHADEVLQAVETLGQ